MDQHEIAQDHRPLAETMRPQSLDQFVGQTQLVGEGAAVASRTPVLKRLLGLGLAAACAGAVATRGTFAGYRSVRPSKRQSARRDPIVSGLSHRSAVALRAYSIAARERARKGLTVRSRALISTAAL